MKKLDNKELKSTIGGVSIWAILGTIAAIVFGVGTLDGYARPLKCNN